MKKIIISIALCMFFGTTWAQQQNPVSAPEQPRTQVVMETSMGEIRMALYNETPLHRDNFIKLVKEGFYDGLLFHRVINKFMIQAGDSASRHAPQGAMLGDSPESYQIPAEIHFPELFHKRGALAAAREPDNVNPERKSSSSQFYIVYGQRFNDLMLDKVQERIDQMTGGKVKLTPEIREVYKTKGGTPHLDGSYTVFGEVTHGMEVVKAIEWVETDNNDRPMKDVRIIKAYVVEP